MDVQQQVLRFMAHRCPRCQLDIVHDIWADQWWTLDATDYSRFGSVG